MTGAMSATRARPRTDATSVERDDDGQRIATVAATVDGAMLVRCDCPAGPIHAAECTAGVVYRPRFGWNEREAVYYAIEYRGWVYRHVTGQAFCPDCGSECGRGIEVAQTEVEYQTEWSVGREAPRSIPPPADREERTRADRDKTGAESNLNEPGTYRDTRARSTKTTLDCDTINPQKAEGPGGNPVL